VRADRGHADRIPRARRGTSWHYAGARRKRNGATLTRKTTLYACPRCHGDLAAGPDALACERGHSFPVTNGLPRFVESETECESFGFQWRKHARTQLDSESRLTLTRDRFFSGTGWPARLDGQRVLEAGCGSGRFTEILLGTGADVFSFDVSRAAEVTHASFGQAAHVCQASIYEMPFRPGTFDRVLCYGVIQHCPDPRLAFLKLAEMARPGGHVALDVYDRRRALFHSRYRIRWLTRRLDPARLYAWCRRLVPLYMKLFPPLHPWNQLLIPIKDYRGALPGLTREQEVEWSVLDTFDALAPEHDHPQWMSTVRKWCDQAGLVDVEVQRVPQGIQVRARRPA
jgi:SAM-dependent methyltransferase